MKFACGLFFWLFCFCLLACYYSATPKPPIQKEDRCKICSTIADKFLHGISVTSKSNFGGGNTRWEEENLGKYVFSETRFIEIVENICTSESKECHQMLEAQEELLEMWWKKFYAQRIESDLREYLCVRRLKVCCPSGTFGPDCRDCKGGRKNPCGGSGKCDGDGTKDGTGECRCEVGYEGDLCQRCSEGFYDDDGSEEEGEGRRARARPATCIPCHQACKVSCSGRGPERCHACKEGWVMVKGTGCSDLNECEDESMCSGGEFCVNTEGSYKCNQCHKACGQCRGPSVSDCITCNARYHRDTNDTCTACHESCVKSCSDQTAATCDRCRKGWKVDEGGVCRDVNECLASDVVLRCSQDEYCVNSVGSYKCSTCHPNCNGCHGAGNNKCKECKDGYRRDAEDSCIDIDECNRPKGEGQVEGEACPGSNMKCVNLPGSYRCDCLPGFKMRSGLCVPSASAGSESDQEKSSIQGRAPASSRNANEPKKIKRAKKVPLYKRDLPQYLMRLAAFTIVCRLTRWKLLVQSAVSFAFAGYLYYYASELEGSMSKS